MKVRFWGTRGSLPIALTAEQVLNKVAAALHVADGRRFDDMATARAYAATLPFAVRGTFGGHSSCVELEFTPPTAASHEYFLCDLGSGVRPFGNHVISRHGAHTPNTFHVFVSHVHWDHIMGLPLFTPSYLPGNELRIYGCHRNLEAALRRQHGAPSFPVEFDQLGASINFISLTPGTAHQIAGVQVTPILQLHAGDSYGYRFEYNHKTVVYSTDAEHKLDVPAATERFVDFLRDADLVIFDAMYSLADAVSVKEDWGHSSNVVGVELCQLAGAKHLVLFHHEPVSDDARIAVVEAESRRFETITRDGHRPLAVTAAYDGLEMDL